MVRGSLPARSEPKPVPRIPRINEMPEVLIERALTSSDPTSALQGLLDRALADRWLVLERHVRRVLAEIEQFDDQASESENSVPFE